MLDSDDRARAARDPWRRPAVVFTRPLRVLWRVASACIAVALVALVVVERCRGAEALSFLGVGFAIGVVTCIPIGVANVTVIDTVYRHGVLRAIAVGLGGALADGIYASIGIFGVGRLLARHPSVPYALYALSGAVLVVYGASLARARAVALTERDAAPPARGGRGLDVAGGVLVGLLATLLNPSAIVTWVVIVGSYTVGVGAVGGAAWLAGIVLGSFSWFVVVALLARRGQQLLRERAIWLTRAIGLLVVAYGLVSLARALRYVIFA